MLNNNLTKKRAVSPKKGNKSKQVGMGVKRKSLAKKDLVSAATSQKLTNFFKASKTAKQEEE